MFEFLFNIAVFIGMIFFFIKVFSKAAANAKKKSSSQESAPQKAAGMSAHESQQAARDIEQAKIRAAQRLRAMKEGAEEAQIKTAQPDVGIMQPDIAPMVATSVRISPHNHENMFAGSMNADNSGEGKDPCHDDYYETAETALHPAYDAETSPSGSVMPQWTGDELVRAVIMQEVLNRKKR